MGLGSGGIAVAICVYGVGAVTVSSLSVRLADRTGLRRTLGVINSAEATLMRRLAMLPLASVWNFLGPRQACPVAFAPGPVLRALNAAAIHLEAALGAAEFAAWSLGAIGLAGRIVALHALAHLRATA